MTTREFRSLGLDSSSLGESPDRARRLSVSPVPSGVLVSVSLLTSLSLVTTWVLLIARLDPVTAIPLPV